MNKSYFLHFVSSTLCFSKWFLWWYIKCTDFHYTTNSITHYQVYQIHNFFLLKYWLSINKTLPQVLLAHWWVRIGFVEEIITGNVLSIHMLVRTSSSVPWLEFLKELWILQLMKCQSWVFLLIMINACLPTSIYGKQRCVQKKAPEDEFIIFGAQVYRTGSLVIEHVSPSVRLCVRSSVRYSVSQKPL